MDKYGLDGLIASTRINVYYTVADEKATDQQPRGLGLGQAIGDFSEFGVLPRREDVPATYVLTGPEITRLAHMPTWMPKVIGASYRPRPGWQSFDPTIEEPDAADYDIWPRRPEGAEGVLTKRWQELLKAHTGNWEATPFWGLHRAIREAGLQRGTVGADDPRLIDWLREAGMPDLKGVDAAEIFREIRMIKSEPEIKLMRTAAVINERACDAAIDALHDGAAWREVENAYLIEMLRQGGEGTFISPGPGGLPNGKVERGQPMLLDAFGTYARYYGDVGRTAIVGEATEEMRRLNRAMLLGAEAARGILRDGVTATALVQQVLRIIREAEFPGFVLVGPHSVGLEHIDHPKPQGGAAPGSAGELTFRKHMVVSLDMPYYEYGWGSMHLEDNLLVTETGCELLSSGRGELREVPINGR
jgi:Xaa-Pro aminopeptidase